MIRRVWVCLLVICFLALSATAQESLKANKDDVGIEKMATGEKAAGKNLAVAGNDNAPGKADAEKPAKPADLQEAIVHMPGMTKDNVQTIAEALKDFNDIESMKPDFEAKNLHVIFGGKLDFKTGVMEKLQAVDSEAKLIDIKKAEAVPAGKCGGCPSRSKCAGAEKTESKKEAPEKSGC